MIEKCDIETLVEKVGGAFRLTVLLQKRLKELKAGTMRFGNPKADNLLDLICREILENKIDLTTLEQLDAATENVHEMFRGSKTAEKIFQ